MIRTTTTNTSRAVRRLIGVVLGAVALSTITVTPAGAGAVQKPMGFERWEDPAASCGPGSSGVDFGLDPGKIFEEYAAQMSIAGPSDGPQFDQKDKRLIDIEVHSDGSGLGYYVYDVVWVCNQGDFALESWFVPGLTEAEVDQLDEFDSIVIADIERYPQGQEWRYSAVIQRNSGKFDWQVLLHTTPTEVSIAVRRLNARVLDVDQRAHCFNDGRRSKGDDPQQGCPAILDAVVVENTGTNHVAALGPIGGFPASSPSGHQLVDLELSLTMWVSSTNPFEVVDSDEPANVVHSHGHVGRVIDLEVFENDNTDGSGSTFDYRTVNLTDQ